MKKIFVLTTTLFLSVCEPAYAQVCMSYEQMKNTLEKQNNQQVIVMGIDNRGNLFQVYSSPNGETWSVILVYPDGKACLMDVGESLEWEPLTPEGEMS